MQEPRPTKQHLRVSKGNMYQFVTHTLNFVKGKCPHDCSYCYMKIFPLGLVRLDTDALEADLGESNFIFVGSSCDMFADTIPYDWIDRSLATCRKFDKNRYLFQTKNPKRMNVLKNLLPRNSLLGTTIESNRAYPDIMRKAPSVSERALFMGILAVEGFKTMVTIEPILDFDLDELVELIKMCKPAWVNIGADSKKHDLPEPSKDKVLKLILALREFTVVKEKRNLERLIK